MNTVNQIHKCSVCGNFVNFVHAGAGELVCCGKPMMLLRENTVDAAVEKHIPIVEQTERGIKVMVGEVEHSMEEAHYIEWIEIITEEGKNYRQDLKPGQSPVAEFCTNTKKITVREYCNLHGLWKIEVNL